MTKVKKNETVETGDIIYANLKLSGKDNDLYYLTQEEGLKNILNRVFIE